MKKSIEPIESRIIYTLDAKCRDCYRCIRGCPVKAISIEKGQAKVEQSRCISCGTCVRECPQNAKVFRNDVSKVIELLAGEVTAVAGIAPAFAAYFEPWQRLRFVSALRMMGFSRVEEVASAAFAVSAGVRKNYESNPNESYICTACPVSVFLAEKYYEKAALYLGKEPSPMIEHAARVKKNNAGEMVYVFFGPCIAKKAEAERKEYEGLVDAVLTFTETEKLFEHFNINLKACEESSFDSDCYGQSRLYPIAGGLIQTAYNSIPEFAILAEGHDMTRKAFDASSKYPYLIETLFCDGGCINGPGMNFTVPYSEIPYYERRTRFVKYTQENNSKESEYTSQNPILRSRFKYIGIPEAKTYTQEEINEVWARTGKSLLEQRLDCGLCGYFDCYQQAVAILDGRAEGEMCLPYVRRSVEQKTDKIIETTPNGIVTLNSELRIIKMNKAFEKLFKASNYMGKHIGELMDPVPFESLAIGTSDHLEFTATHPELRLTCNEIYYAIREDEQYVGIFIDVTRFMDSDRELGRMRKETLEKAKELMEHQVQTAQSMALFLGENTAKSEELLSKLIKLADEADENEKI